MTDQKADPRQYSLGAWAGLIASALVMLGVIAYVVWYSSAALFPSFPYIHNDYADLGDAFLHGQLALLDQPSPQLQALTNPYDFEQRANVPFRWDASYYAGKYYLYWGPVPALISAGMEAIESTPPSGALLVLPAYAGMVIAFVGLLVSMWQRSSSRGASLALGLVTAVTFISFPSLFELGQSRVYEASILYGQFFLLSGLLCWELYRRSFNVAWLCAAGLSWALAVGSRYNLLISVAIFLVFALIWMKRSATLNWRSVTWMVAPLLVGAILGGLYNALRFGDPLETGKAYQLTATAPQGIEYSLAFVPSNLYIYLLYPLTTAGKFPFVKSALFDPQVVPAWLQVPPGREFDHVIFGTLSAAPFLWMLVPAIVVGIGALARRRPSPTAAKQDTGWKFDVAMLGAGAVAQFLFVAVYYYGAERFVGDFFFLFLLALAGVLLQVDALLRGAPWLRASFWILAAGLGLWAIAIGYFGAFSVPPKTFAAANPTLYGQLASYWNDRFETVQLMLDRIGRLTQLFMGSL